MSNPTFNNFSHLWNDLPDEERKRMMPHMLESHMLHIWQCKKKAVLAHKKHMKELDEIGASLNRELKRLAQNTPSKD